MLSERARIIVCESRVHGVKFKLSGFFRVSFLRSFFAANVPSFGLPEQQSSMETIYDGHGVFVWLPTGYLSSAAIPLGFQARVRQQREAQCCVRRQSIDSTDD